jgi:imidazolonepropionase-like amidohydrolase
MAALYRRVEAGTITAGEEQDLKRMEARSEKPLDTVRGMLACGLKGQIIPGTDCGVGNLEFGHLDYDMALLVRAGFTLGEALLAATKVSAEAIGMGDQIGSIEAGKVADLAAFAGDPTTNLAALSQTVAVFQQGQRVR